MSSRSRPMRRPLPLPRLSRERRCASCGCTDRRTCPGGCTWGEADLCSSCRPVRLRCPEFTARCVVVAVELCQLLPVGRRIQQAAQQVAQALRLALGHSRPGRGVVVWTRAGSLRIVMQTLPQVLPELAGQPAWMRRMLEDFLGLPETGSGRRCP